MKSTNSRELQFGYCGRVCQGVRRQHNGNPHSQNRVLGKMYSFNRSIHVGVMVDAKSNMKERKILNDVIYVILVIMF
jgi:hypothetical protein